MIYQTPSKADGGCPPGANRILLCLRTAAAAGSTCAPPSFSKKSVESCRMTPPSGYRQSTLLAKTLAQPWVLHTGECIQRALTISEGTTAGSLWRPGLRQPQRKSIATAQTHMAKSRILDHLPMNRSPRGGNVKSLLRLPPVRLTLESRNGATNGWLFDHACCFQLSAAVTTEVETHLPFQASIFRSSSSAPRASQLSTDGRHSDMTNLQEG